MFFEIVGYISVAIFILTIIGIFLYFASSSSEVKIGEELINVSDNDKDTYVRQVLKVELN